MEALRLEIECLKRVVGELKASQVPSGQGVEPPLEPGEGGKGAVGGESPVVRDGGVCPASPEAGNITPTEVESTDSVLGSAGSADSELGGGKEDWDRILDGTEGEDGAGGGASAAGGGVGGKVGPAEMGSPMDQGSPTKGKEVPREREDPVTEEEKSLDGMFEIYRDEVAWSKARVLFRKELVRMGVWPEEAASEEGEEQPGEATELQGKGEDGPAVERGDGQPGTSRGVPSPVSSEAREGGGETGRTEERRPAGSGVAPPSSQGAERGVVGGEDWVGLKRSGVGRGRGPGEGGRRIETRPRLGGVQAAQGRQWEPIGPEEVGVVSGKRKGGPDEEPEEGGDGRPESPVVDPVGSVRGTGGAGIPVLLPAGSEPSRAQGGARPKDSRATGAAVAGVQPLLDVPTAGSGRMRAVAESWREPERRVEPTEGPIVPRSAYGGTWTSDGLYIDWQGVQWEFKWGFYRCPVAACLRSFRVYNTWQALGRHWVALHGSQAQAVQWYCGWCGMVSNRRDRVASHIVQYGHGDRAPLERVVPAEIPTSIIMPNKRPPRGENAPPPAEVVGQAPGTGVRAPDSAASSAEAGIAGRGVPVVQEGPSRGLGRGRARGVRFEAGGSVEKESEEARPGAGAGRGGGSDCTRLAGGGQGRTPACAGCRWRDEEIRALTQKIGRLEEGSRRLAECLGGLLGARS